MAAGRRAGKEGSRGTVAYETRVPERRWSRRR